MSDSVSDRPDRLTALAEHVTASLPGAVIATEIRYGELCCKIERESLLRVLRPEIQRVAADPRRPGEVAALITGRRGEGGAITHAPVPCGPPVEASPGTGPAFSSPGNILSIPSQGDRKSK